MKTPRISPCLQTHATCNLCGEKSDAKLSFKKQRTASPSTDYPNPRPRNPCTLNDAGQPWSHSVLRGLTYDATARNPTTLARLHTTRANFRDRQSARNCRGILRRQPHQKYRPDQTSLLWHIVSVLCGRFVWNGVSAGRCRWLVPLAPPDDLLWQGLHFSR
jgi:hypothetical protein